MANLNHKPLVSVVIPVYNGEKYIEETIKSILNQTYPNFELILVNDCSPDNSHLILHKYEKLDKRVKNVKNQKNIGISSTINNGITHARGKYLAMSDQDDISYPTRFEKEVGFLESHEDFGMVGSCFDNIDDKGNIINSFDPPLNETDFYWWMIFSSPVCAPSVMVRMSCLRENNIEFRSEFDLTQDYDVWSRLCKVSKGINLKDKLTGYRLHSEQNTSTSFAKQQERATQVTIRELAYYLKREDIIREDVVKIRKWNFVPPQDFDLTDVSAIKLLHEIAEKFIERKGTDKKIFTPILNLWQNKLRKVCIKFPK